MGPIAKVVYPTPPPTTNNLTTKQRSLLLRKAKKIEQILGYPPHLIDTLCNTDGTTASSPPSINPPHGRCSLESCSSTLTGVDSLEKKDDVSWFCYGSRNAANTNHTKGMSQIPLLRAASNSMRLELMAVTNLPVKPSVTIGSKSAPPPDSDLPLKSSPTDPTITLPTFTIPTSHTHRKAKMDRIRKRLGSEVPCEVVFPEDVVGSKWCNSEKHTPRRKVAATKPLPTVQPNPSQRHLVVNVKKERLSFIQERSDESSGSWQELTGEFPRMQDGTARRRDTANSSTCSENSDRDGQGVLTLRKKLSSYRKPPPPMLDDSVCSF